MRVSERSIRRRISSSRVLISSLARLHVKGRHIAGMKKAARRLLFSWQSGRLDQLFLDAGGLAGQLAQVVQLGLAYVTATLDRDAVNDRGVSLEGTLDANTVGNLAHGESAVQAA